MNSHVELENIKQHVDIEAIQQYFLYKMPKEVHQNKVLTNIIPQKYKDTCLTIAVEELSELQKEVCKLHRGTLRRDKLIEEIADVQIIIEWLESLVEITEDEINTIKQEKIDRILHRYTNNEFQ